MNCDRASELVADQLKGSLAAEHEAELREHLVICQGCLDETSSLTDLWQRLGDLEEEVPSDRMRATFYSALAEAERDESERSIPWTDRLGAAFASIWPRNPAFQLTLLLLAALVGWGIGGRSAGNRASDVALQEMRGELAAMNQRVALSLMQHSAASQRLRGVEWSVRGSEDRLIIDSLLDRVRNDENLNVRLAAVETLAQWVDRQSIYTELAETLPAQKSPLMQITLADLLLAANPDASQAVVREVLQREDLSPEVRSHFEQSLYPQI